MSSLTNIAQILNQMGFPNELKENTIEAQIPLPYASEYVQPFFKLSLSPEQKLIYYQPNRHSTRKLLRNVEPLIRDIARNEGLTFISG